MERTIQYIRHAFFAARPFTTLEDFNRQALQWRDSMAHARRCPGDDSRLVREVCFDEQPCLLPLSEHPFTTDRILPIRSGKTIYVRFDLNDYSIPPSAVGRPLILVASPTTVRLLDANLQIAQHHRSYDRHQQILNPDHQQALLDEKRRAAASSASGRLQQAVPESEAFLDAAFQRGESAAWQTTQLLHLSRLGRFKPMTNFDWQWPRKIDRELIERAFTLDFIQEARNLLLLGANGLGKTMIVKNIAFQAVQAVQAGYSVLFRSASEILEDLQSSSPDLCRRKLKTYARYDLLCCDEVGYLSYDNNAADLLFEIFNRRYERRSSIVSTNKAFKDWNSIFPNAGCIVTLLDRLTHHADCTVIEGQSYRVRESEQETAARRKKR